MVVIVVMLAEDLSFRSTLLPDKEFPSTATGSVSHGTQEQNLSNQETTEDTPFVSLALLELVETDFPS